MLAKNQAIVMGGSIAGLAAAKVLAESFEHVLVLEQDDPPTADHPRRYVPQSGYAHLLTRGGVIAAEQLFPGFAKEMEASGIRPIDETQEAYIFLHGVRIRNVATSSYVYPQTRAHLEHYFYKRVLPIPNVKIRHHVRVQGLLWDDKHEEVLGVTLTNGEHLKADLVVDASGRTSRLPQWLEDAGCMKPRTETIHIDMAYTFGIFRNRPDMDPTIMAHLEQDSPENKARTGVILPIDSNRWYILLCGYHGDHAPHDREGFLKFAESLPTPKVAHAIKVLELQGDINTYHYKEAVWHRFDQMARHPLGIIALGDAVCSVNPKFGQGMSKALQEASALQTLLSKNIPSNHLAHQFYKKTLPFIDSAWGAGASEDFLMPQTTGDKPKNLKVMQGYFNWVVKAASYDQRMALAFLQVLILARRATSLLTPLIILRVLFDHFIREKLLRQHKSNTFAQAKG